jgi:hypothetical protein
MSDQSIPPASAKPTDPAFERLRLVRGMVVDLAVAVANTVGPPADSLLLLAQRMPSPVEGVPDPSGFG